MQIGGDTCISCIFLRYCHFESREGSGNEELKRFRTWSSQYYVQIIEDNKVSKGGKFAAGAICSKVQVTGSSNGLQV